jgi:hypothetical protein
MSNATPTAQLLDIRINAIFSNVPAGTDSAASTIVVTAIVKSRASRALKE